MDPLRLLSQSVGFFTREQARQFGYDDRAVASLVRRRVWHRFRRGYYVYADLWADLDAMERHLVRCRAVLDSMGDRVALSHVSAALLHGVSTWGVPLDRVHVTRLDGGAGRIERDVVHHEGLCGVDDLVEVEGLQAVRPERSVVETASQGSPESALVTFDSALHLGVCTEDELLSRFQLMGHWPHTQHLHVPLRMADGRSASAGESRGRWLFWVAHLPAPDLQVRVRDGRGELVGITDWAWWGHELLGEFDGKVKYGRLLRPGQEPGDAVFAEKKREDRLREVTGARMLRLTWDDYRAPEATAARIRHLLRMAG